MGLSTVHTEAWTAGLYYCFLLNCNFVFYQSLVILCNAGKSALIRSNKYLSCWFLYTHLSLIHSKQLKSHCRNSNDPKRPHLDMAWILKTLIFLYWQTEKCSNIYSPCLCSSPLRFLCKHTLNESHFSSLLSCVLFFFFLIHSSQIVLALIFLFSKHYYCSLLPLLSEQIMGKE